MNESYHDSRLWDKSNRISWTLFLLILVFAAGIRFIGIDDRSLLQDESTMLEFTRGLMKNGYPSLERGTSELPMATYELVPYFIAPMVMLFGWTETAVRLPALIFGLGTLVLIFLAGRAWFNIRVALWASFLYALSPWAVYWSQNCFYPAQVQFFALLSTYLVFRLLKKDKSPPWLYYLTALSLCATYLSWEASGLIFLAYAVLALWLRWGRWAYLLTPHAWIALALVGVVVIGQLARRAMIQQLYLTIGSSRAEISSPQFAVNQSIFDPYYYLDDVFGSEQLILLGVFFLLGLFFLRGNWHLKFVYGFVILVVGIYTGLLAVQAIRYVYLVLPVFLIAVSAATFYLVGWMSNGRGSFQLISIRILRPLLILTFLTIQGLSVSVNGLNLAELRAAYRGPGPWELRPDVYGVDFRYAVRALQREYLPGDIIIARGPFLLHLYMGIKGDYALQEITGTIVVYEPHDDRPYYIDKWIGNPVLRNLDELKALLLRHQRVWFLATPFGPARQSLGDELYSFIRESMVLKDEGQNVRLYLWERGSLADQATQQ
jgi:4-amino-4-deoxy-L-arabinose transferase-like glycosyltransferase